MNDNQSYPPAAINSTVVINEQPILLRSSPQKDQTKRNFLGSSELAHY